MELSERHLKTLQDEGFTSVYEVFDEPGSHYPTHSHPHAVTILISEGNMEVAMNDETQNLQSGDRLDIPEIIGHSAKAGPGGCKYVVGER